MMTKKEVKSYVKELITLKNLIKKDLNRIEKIIIFFKKQSAKKPLSLKKQPLKKVAFKGRVIKDKAKKSKVKTA